VEPALGAEAALYLVGLVVTLQDKQHGHMWAFPTSLSHVGIRAEFDELVPARIAERGAVSVFIEHSVHIQDLICLGFTGCRIFEVESHGRSRRLR